MIETKNISKLSGYRLPEDYLDNFNVENIGHDNSQSGGFKVPESYFESFTVTPPKPSKIVYLYNYKSIAVAAVLIVISCTMLINLISLHKTNESLDFSKIDKEQLYDYIEDELYLDHDLYINNADKPSPSSTPNFSEDDVLDYLDDSSIEQLIDY